MTGELHLAQDRGGDPFAKVVGVGPAARRGCQDCAGRRAPAGSYPARAPASGTYQYRQSAVSRLGGDTLG
jgi:hypothetical protein